MLDLLKIAYLHMNAHPPSCLEYASSLKADCSKAFTANSISSIWSI